MLEHGNYGIHNASISVDENDKPRVASFYDWETACIIPTLLSDSLVKVSPVNLGCDEDGRPSTTYFPKGATLDEQEVYATWAKHYVKVSRLFTRQCRLCLTIHLHRYYLGI